MHSPAKGETKEHPFTEPLLLVPDANLCVSHGLSQITWTRTLSGRDFSSPIYRYKNGGSDRLTVIDSAEDS